MITFIVHLRVKPEDAPAFEATANVEVRAGIHTADSASITIAKAGKKWIETSELGAPERDPRLPPDQHPYGSPHLGGRARGERSSRPRAAIVTALKASICAPL